MNCHERIELVFNLHILQFLHRLVNTKERCISCNTLLMRSYYTYFGMMEYEDPIFLQVSMYLIANYANKPAFSFSGPAGESCELLRSNGVL